MNKDLQGRDFVVPPYVIKYIDDYRSKNSGIGEIRAENIIRSGSVTYGQLKKILHDLKYMDKQKDVITYNLCGGDEMERWGSTLLGNEREFIQDKKKSKEQADIIGGINGIVKNAHNTKHTKKTSTLPPLNLMKSNSDKTSVSTISSFKLFEEIKRIKKLMI